MPGVEVERSKVLDALFSFSPFFLVLIEYFTSVETMVVVSRTFITGVVLHR